MKQKVHEKMVAFVAFIWCLPTTAGHGAWPRVRLIYPERFPGETDFPFQVGISYRLLLGLGSHSCPLPLCGAGTLPVWTPAALTPAVGHYVSSVRQSCGSGNRWSHLGLLGLRLLPPPHLHRSPSFEGRTLAEHFCLILFCSSNW